MTRTPIEQATIFLNLGNYRRAAEILLQIIMEQDKRLADLEKRLSPSITFEYAIQTERNFTDGLEQGSNYCPHCKGPCKRNFCIYCGADHGDCKCENKTII